jgi:hypothetical protein
MAVRRSVGPHRIPQLPLEELSKINVIRKPLQKLWNKIRAYLNPKRTTVILHTAKRTITISLPN